MAKAATISELQRLLNSKKKRVQLLQKRKAKLTAQIARIDRQITSLLGKEVTPRKVRPRRRRRGKSLQQYVLDVLTQSPQPRSAPEIAEAVTAAGYRSSSKNLVSMVRQACYKSDQIQTKQRGKFAPAATAKTPRPRPKRKKAVPKK